VKARRRDGKRTKFPIRVEFFNTHANIYRHARKKKGVTYEEFKVAFHDDGKRKFRSFATMERAERYANELLVAINNGETAALMLSGADKASYLRAVELIRETGKPIEVAASQFVAAHKALRGAADVVSAAEFYARQYLRQPEPKTIAEVVAELVETKEKADCSRRYIEDLRQRCGKFAGYFEGMPVLKVTDADVRDFLSARVFGRERNEVLGPRSRNNFIVTIRTLLKFAKERDYLPQDFRTDRVKLVKDRGGEIGIYTPREMADLLAQAKDDDVLFLAVGGFAGVRTEEILRMHLDEIKWRSAVVEITAGKAKTASRRLVPIADNLRAWVEPIAKARGHRGPVWQHSRAYLHERMETLFARAGVKRKANGLRHSFISYRVAETQNVAQVALEAGNSPTMIFSNYRELVTREDATAWFSIMPAQAARAGEGKVIAMPK